MQKITNFGGNVSFTSKNLYTPATDQEVLDILNKHQSGQIKVLSSLHSWSEVTATSDVLIDLKKFKKIDLIEDQQGTTAEIGAGATLQEILNHLRQTSGYTLPTLGGIKKQTIAGAIATGTHGTGRPSLSHYIEEVRLAAYDPATGQAKIYKFNSGQELLAARCSLGCLGVILSVKIRLAEKYWMSEQAKKYDTLNEVLAKKDDFPLQQFALFPYSWKFYVYHRKITDKPKSLLKIKLYKIYDYLVVEIFLHLLVKLFQQLGRGAIYWWWQKAVPRLLGQHQISGDSETILTLHTEHHYTFRHEEMEIFVPESNIFQAAEIIKKITTDYANSGQYVHHYPIFFRYVLPEETLISMASGNQPYYSVSFFTYRPPQKRQPYYDYTLEAAKTLVQKCQARIHWGKRNPLSYNDLKHLYPNLEEFKQLCQSVDPKGVFQNDYIRRVLGLELNY
ncbi:MAG TPA: D-arabinono-1,4-lactone oxidase [Patescibacteria group bacterium]